MLKKTQGLILKLNKLGENDALFTILTKDMQKITAISKGIQSLKHKDFAALKLFCYSEMELSSKGNLYYVSSAQIINNFYNLRSSVEKLSAAAYIADVACIVSDFAQGEDEYFRFILNTLYFIEHSDESENPTAELKKLKCLFELRSADFAGFKPNTKTCTKCGKEKPLVYFDADEGGALCADCGGEFSDYIGEAAIKTIDFLCNSDLKSAFKMTVKNEDVFNAINIVSEKYISAKAEYYFKSLGYLKSFLV